MVLYITLLIINSSFHISFSSFILNEVESVVIFFSMYALNFDVVELLMNLIFCSKYGKQHTKSTEFSEF